MATSWTRNLKLVQARIDHPDLTDAEIGILFGLSEATVRMVMYTARSAGIIGYRADEKPKLSKAGSSVTEPNRPAKKKFPELVVDRLTQEQVDAMTDLGDHLDGGGLYLSIRSGGGLREWRLRYHNDKKWVVDVLGSARVITLVEARTLAKRRWQQVRPAKAA